MAEERENTAVLSYRVVLEGGEGIYEEKKSRSIARCEAARRKHRPWNSSRL